MKIKDHGSTSFLASIPITAQILYVLYTLLLAPSLTLWILGLACLYNGRAEVHSLSIPHYLLLYCKLYRCIEICHWLYQ